MKSFKEMFTSTVEEQVALHEGISSYFEEDGSIIHYILRRNMKNIGVLKVEIKSVKIATGDVSEKRIAFLSLYIVKEGETLEERMKNSEADKVEGFSVLSDQLFPSIQEAVSKIVNETKTWTNEEITEQLREIQKFFASSGGMPPMTADEKKEFAISSLRAKFEPEFAEKAYEMLFERRKSK